MANAQVRISRDERTLINIVRSMDIDTHKLIMALLEINNTPVKAEELRKGGK